MKKIISLLICMAMLISMSVIPVSAETYGKAWEFDGTTVEGWGGNGSTLTVSDGVLIQAPKTNNKFLVSPSNLGLDASTYKYLKVRMKNDTSEYAHFRFEAIGTNNTAYTGAWNYIEGDVNTPTIPNDGEFHEYVVDLSKFDNWSGTIKQFRLCMNRNYATTGNCEFDYIRLSDTGDLSACEVSLDSLTNPTDIALGESIELTATATGDNVSKVEYLVNGTSVGSATEAPYTVNWTPSAVGGYHVKAVATFAAGTLDSDVAYVSVYNPNVVENNAYIWNFNGSVEGWFANASTRAAADNCLVQSVEANKYNSFLLSPSGLSIDASKYKYIKIRVAGEYAEKGLLGIQWITTDDTAWDEKWSLTDKTKVYDGTPVENDGYFHEYVIDLSEHSGWTGTVSRLRIKITPNTTTLAATAKVDFIRISDTLANGIDSSLVPAEAPEVTVEEVGRYTNEGSNPAIAYTGTFNLNSVAVSGVKWTVADKSADVELGEAMSGEGTVVVGLIIELANTAIGDYTAVPTAECIAAE